MIETWGLAVYAVSEFVVADAIDKAASGASQNYSLVSTEQAGSSSSSRCWCVAVLSSPVSAVATPSHCDLLKSVQF